MALSDEELVAKYHEAGGRPHGTVFADELFERHYSRVALWCFRIAGDRDKAADLAQEVFAKAWAHLDHFRAESKFSTWLFTIARNHSFTRLKRESQRQEDLLDPADLDFLTATEPGFVGDLERSGQMEMAQGLMASELNTVETQVMTLHYAQELPLDAISRLLHLDNASGAKAYIVSAKRKLKSAIQKLHKASEHRRQGHD